MKYLKRFNESFPGDNIEATIRNGNILANEINLCANFISILLV